MIDKIKQILFKKLGIDEAISFALWTQVLNVLRSTISIFLVLKYLTSIEQGFYYTFTSILAIQIFFELGFSGIITQYVAHEKSHLTWQNNLLEGNEVNFSRLRSLLRLSYKWFTVMAIILLLALLITGFIFFSYFSPKSENVNWQMPWVLMSITTACNLIITAAIAYYEGLGRVERTAKLRFNILIYSTTAFFLALCLNFKLYSYAVNNIVGILISVYWLNSEEIRKLFLSIWNYSNREHKVSWRKEIFPFQWKIALSWMSGYFLFQLFNPIIFATLGAVPAGQMGTSQAALNGVFGMSNSWFSTKVPLFSSLIAQKKFKDLDGIFNITLKQSALVLLMCLIILVGLIFIFIEYKLKLSIRFLPLIPFAILAISSFVLFINNALATYLRCHKEEPYLFSSVVLGVVNIFVIWFASKNFGIIGMVSGYLLVMIAGLVWGIMIFFDKKKLWHGS
jgi:O-antigen/teichoic acid export membrane protein